MAQFMALIEPRSASPEDYEELDAAMSERKFSRQIVNNAGDPYILPSGQYGIETELTLLQVHAAAKQAVHNASKRSGTNAGRPTSIMVVEYTCVLWEGLDESA